MYARTVELAVPGVECFGVGRLAGLPFEGRSWIIAPGGPDGVEILARAPNAVEECVISARLELK